MAQQCILFLPRAGFRVQAAPGTSARPKAPSICLAAAELLFVYENHFSECTPTAPRPWLPGHGGSIVPAGHLQGSARPSAVCPAPFPPATLCRMAACPSKPSLAVSNQPGCSLVGRCWGGAGSLGWWWSQVAREGQRGLGRQRSVCLPRCSVPI